MLFQLSEQCPQIDKRFAYYQQRYPDLIDIGSEFSEKYNDWAWGDGEAEFPKELFDTGNDASIYLKHKVCDVFHSLVQKAEIANVEEIELLKRIHPHSIITTNYDQLLETIFDNYTPIIGQKILYANHTSIGEIFKIHGCDSEPASIVITKEDYENFLKKKKYLSAKMLTFFAEHPLVFIGYSAEDPNIKAILTDIDEILAENDEMIPNIYHLEWSNTEISGYPRRERLIHVSDKKSVRIKSIVAHNFSWVYEAFGANQALDNINPKLLRSLLARTYDLVRSDIPRNPIQVDYTVLANVSESDGELAKLYGIADASDGLTFNVNFPLTLSALGVNLGFRGWHDANKLIEIIKEQHGVDIKSFDNKYHCAVMNGSTVQAHRYSNLAQILLKKVLDGEEYELDLP